MRVMALIAVTLGVCGVCFALAGEDSRGIGSDASRTVTLDMVKRDGETPNILRVTFPLGMQLRYGTRMTVEGSAPVERPFSACNIEGCISDYEVTAAVLDGMKSHQALVVQAIDASAKPLTVIFELGGFWMTYHAQQVIPKKTPDEPLKPWREARQRAS